MSHASGVCDLLQDCMQLTLVCEFLRQLGDEAYDWPLRAMVLSELSRALELKKDLTRNRAVTG